MSTQQLDLFAHATHWKSYWSRCIRPFLHGDVLEVGAGIGTNTLLLEPGSFRSWTCLEPDPALAAQAVTDTGRHIVIGDTRNLPSAPAYDAILYIDVLEHIERDREEMERAALLLRPQGNLIVLSPAHQWLYTPFDEAIGHYRRYTRSSLRAVSPPGCVLRRLWYLDAVGVLASSANRLLLHQSRPELRQILLWDRWMVPASTWLDPWLGHRVGKSVLGVWTKL